MLNLLSLSKSYGDQLLFSDLTLHINDRERIGLIGPNGSGKTTLLRIITGEIPPDKGSISCPKNSLIGYLPQNLVELRGSTVMDEVLSGFSEIMELRKELREKELMGIDTEEVAKIYAEISNRYNELNGFSIENEAKEILRGMGFSEEDFERKTEEFSGGWQMRILLSRILLIKPDILLLDEPTNHLDTEVLNWLENYLNGFKGIIFAVTHDRYFLNRFTRRICELSIGKIKNYYGSYEDFLFEKAHIKETVRKKYHEQEKKIKEIQWFINKFKAKKDVRGRVRSRIKMLEKMERIELPKETKSMHFNFPQPSRSGLVTLTLSGIRKSYGSNLVLEGIDFTLDRGDSIGFVGPNGIGKSTLLRILAGEEGFDNGRRKIGHNVTIQFFSQEDLTLEAQGNTVLEEAQITAPELEISRLRSYLGAFLFTGNDVEKRIEVLSGGERSRLKLAKMLLKPANLLILDEPSNHLDLQGKEVLEEALSQFTGTIILVSHDRFMLDKVCNKTATITDKQLKLYWGNYSYYHDKRKEEQVEERVREKGISGKKKTKERKRREAEKRNLIYLKKEEIEKLENSIIEMEEDIEGKEKLLLHPEIYKSGSEVKKTIKEIEILKTELENLYFNCGEKQKLLDNLIENLQI
ncbi:ABC-F family ATP-binding cassette domain-containing protein [candidate division WOR-3 bacterium]|nr:ABC-F family ATP-binding cassette domain-containing protein [candidate division WOR-3 bacterium]